MTTQEDENVIEPAYTTAGRTKYIIVATAVILAFFAAYGFAISRHSVAPADAAAVVAPAGDGQLAAGG